MSMIQTGLRLRSLLNQTRSFNSFSVARTLCSSSPSSTSTAAAPIPSSTPAKTSEATFAHLMRNCQFTQMGDPVGKVVIGRIYHVVEDDLYIDFGGKFPCVCPRPKRNGRMFRRGSQVRILIKSLELTERFLGFSQDITLLEADGVLLGLDNIDVNDKEDKIQ